jgi:hypothetical protein
VELWSDRPFEIANNLNPAFCSIIIFDAINNYGSNSDYGMDYPLSFLILPIILHRRSREILPRSVRNRMHVWLQDNSEIRVGFAQRVRSLIPYTEETLRFGLQNRIYKFNEDGGLITVKNKIINHKFPKNSEPDICRQKARLLGRWFAITGETRTIYTMWGIRP